MNKDFVKVRVTVEQFKLEMWTGPMPNVMVALPNIGGALCSTRQSLADAHYSPTAEIRREKKKKEEQRRRRNHRAKI